jgi:hypothetical protein
MAGTLIAGQSGGNLCIGQAEMTGNYTYGGLIGFGGFFIRIRNDRGVFAVGSVF